MSYLHETSACATVTDRPTRLWIMSDLHMETTRGWDLHRSDLRDLMVAKDPTDGCGVPHPADLWAFGHTHESFDAVVGGTRVISNGKGYGPWRGDPGWENRSFDPAFVVEV